MGKVEEEIDRKVTLVALRSFLLGDGGLEMFIGAWTILFFGKICKDCIIFFFF